MPSSCYVGTQLAGQLLDIPLIQAKQVENITETLPVETGGGLELHFALGAPGDAESGGVEHEEVVGAVADGHCLGDGDGILSGEGLQEGAFSSCVDDGIGWDEFAG